MATDTQIKVRQAVALDRVMQAAGKLAARFPAVEAPEIPTRLRYPELLPLMQMEAVAGFLEALVNAQDAPEGAKGGDPASADGSGADGGTETSEAAWKPGITVDNDDDAPAPKSRKGKAS